MRYYLEVPNHKILGTISYKDTETSTETSQKIQSVDTTATVVTETFQADRKNFTTRLISKKTI